METFIWCKKRYPVKLSCSSSKIETLKISVSKTLAWKYLAVSKCKFLWLNGLIVIIILHTPWVCKLWHGLIRCDSEHAWLLGIDDYIARCSHGLRRSVYHAIVRAIIISTWTFLGNRTKQSRALRMMANQV